MVSGDHFDTAKQVAIKAGILSKSEANDEKGKFIMTGEDFRKICGNS
jgi:magnesium-transporting ATPase (P-type)